MTSTGKHRISMGANRTRLEQAPKGANALLRSAAYHSTSLNMTSQNLLSQR